MRGHAYVDIILLHEKCCKVCFESGTSFIRVNRFLCFACFTSVLHITWPSFDDRRSAPILHLQLYCLVHRLFEPVKTQLLDEVATFGSHFFPEPFLLELVTKALQMESPSSDKSDFRKGHVDWERRDMCVTYILKEVRVVRFLAWRDYHASC